MAISQSASFENLGMVLFISLTIDFSSFASFSLSLLIGGSFGAEREGETMVLFLDWDDDSDDEGDGDRDGVLTLDVALVFRLGYLDSSFGFLARPCIGRFQ